MRTKLAFSICCVLLTAAAGAIGSAGCGSDDPVVAAPQDSGVDTGTVTPPPPTNEGGTKLAQGATCTAGAACQSGQCVDGVCCESTCSGSCERCNLPGSLGKCEAVPDGQDPDKECNPTPLPDAGTEEQPMPDAGGDAEAGAADAGPVFAIPDGGPPAVNDNMCAGHCNGKRACAFAGTEVSCGTAFCGNRSQQGRASCDGKGHCMYGIEECSAYACPDGSPGCKASCSAPSDCLATHYCDGPSSTCKPRFGNGTTCASPDQCQSGVCDTTGGAGGVCCNIDCSTTPGGTCRKSGAVGTCQCSACPTGACALFYRDEDADGYGDKDGTVANGRAQYACADESNKPAGFVKDNTDCLDSTAAVAKNVHPGQTQWFTSAYTNAAGAQTFDYNCSGTTEKETWEGGCGFCRNNIIFPQPGPEPEPPMSKPEGVICLIQFFTPNCPSTSSNAGRYCDCGAQNPPSFNTTVACGTPGSAYTCNKCTAANGTSSTTFSGSITQRCH